MKSVSLTIPEGVRVIGKNAHGFGIRVWENVKNIVLPEGLEVIDDNAFCGFKNLEEINLPSTLVRIGDNAFTNCSSLANVAFPEGLKEIGKSAFSGMAGTAVSCTGKSIFVFSGDTLFPRSKPAGNSGPDRKKTGKA